MFLTVGVDTILSPEVEGEGFDADAIRESREARGGIADSMAIQRGQTALSYEAMRLAGVDVSELPAFEPVREMPSEMWNQIAGLDWLLAYERSGSASEEGPGHRLVAHAASLSAEPSWEWDEVPGITVVKTADKLSNFREDYSLVLEAISFGYWIRRAEVELTDGFNTFDAGHVEHLREKYEEGEPDTILTVSMNQVREALPEPFSPGPEVWAEVVTLAPELLAAWGQRLLTETAEFDNDVEVTEERREFALGLGYGLGVTVEALGIRGTRPAGVAIGFERPDQALAGNDRLARAHTGREILRRTTPMSSDSPSSRSPST